MTRRLERGGARLGAQRLRVGRKGTTLVSDNEFAVYQRLQ